MFQGLKQKRNHAGILENYTWDKQQCIEEVNNYPDKHPITFSELARAYNLKNNSSKYLHFVSTL